MYIQLYNPQYPNNKYIIQGLAFENDLRRRERRREGWKMNINNSQHNNIHIDLKISIRKSVCSSRPEGLSQAFKWEMSNSKIAFPALYLQSSTSKFAKCSLTCSRLRLQCCFSVASYSVSHLNLLRVVHFGTCSLMCDYLHFLADVRS